MGVGMLVEEADEPSWSVIGEVDIDSCADVGKISSRCIFEADSDGSVLCLNAM
jgi:hypothetical protein